MGIYACVACQAGLVTQEVNALYKNGHDSESI